VTWFGLICIALAIFCAWSVIQLSPQGSLFVTGTSAKASQFHLPDELQFLEDHAFGVLLGVTLALMTWAMVRRPRPR